MVGINESDACGCIGTWGFKMMLIVDLLESVISMEEIKTAVWDCGTNKAPASNMFHEVRIGSNIHLSHLFYADDVIILLDWNQNDMENITRIINIFYIASGLKINFYKSNVFGVRVSNSEVVSMAACTGCEADCRVRKLTSSSLAVVLLLSNPCLEV
nr:hypothetical protein [Tanacetum cinerariifolium]